ncbi:MAG: hypothetical protein GTN70_02925 [Deltaproteobacteria bacterium]|nr:hypothetical protein [Deltaproteobacteria bacterium]NIS76601.1 hypothetical protein [Deltaproteobacteria bacterium]
MTEKYIADATLGRLARWLRLLGVDVESFGEGDFQAFVERARLTTRKIVTRRRVKLPQSAVVILPDRIEEQVKSFFLSEKLEYEEEKFFSRCSLCNRTLEKIGRDAAASRGVPEYVLSTQEDFLTCNGCGRVYWPGSHRERFTEILKSLNLSARKEPDDKDNRREL